MIDASYSSTQNCKQIRDFYNNELKKSGWMFAKEKKVYAANDLYLGSSTIFTKGDHRLSIFSPGNADKEITYVISLSWGVDDD